MLARCAFFLLLPSGGKYIMPLVKLSLYDHFMDARRPVDPRPRIPTGVRFLCCTRVAAGQRQSGPHESSSRHITGATLSPYSFYPYAWYANIPRTMSIENVGMVWKFYG